MVGLAVLVVIVVAASVWTLVELRHDAPREIPRSHATDPDAVPPVERLGRI
jgi:hypothetical protein